MKKIISMMVIFMLIFFMGGCGKINQATPKQSYEPVKKEEAIQRVVKFLDEKYNAKHTVTELYIEGFSPFQTTSHYRGKAYRTAEPDKVFDVYITEDGKQIRDNYFIFPMTVKTNGLYGSICSSVWKQAEASVDFGMLFPKGDWNDGADVKEFLSRENPLLYVTIFINVDKYDEALETENVNNFISKLSGAGLYGQLEFVFLSSTDFSEAVREINSANSYDEFIKNGLIRKKVIIDFEQSKAPEHEQVKKAFEGR